MVSIALNGCTQFDPFGIQSKHMLAIVFCSDSSLKWSPDFKINMIVHSQFD